MKKKINKKTIGIVLGLFFILTPFFINYYVEKSEGNVESKIAKGVQWEAKKDNKIMYLIGTMHPIDTDYNYFSKTINNILKETDVLLVEVDPNIEDIKNLQDNSVYSNGKTIENELNKDEIEALKSISSTSGLDYEKLKVCKSQVIIQNIQSTMYSKAGLSMETFDDKLIHEAKSRGKEVIQLESIKEQMNLLDFVHSVDVLKSMLENYSEESFENQSREIIDYSKNLMDAYLVGNHSFMEEAVEIQKADKDIYNAMILDRNKKMVEKIDEYFKGDKTHTIAVGALHFFGEDGIVEMLKQRGYEVNKL